eukprot:s11_g21.t1
MDLNDEVVGERRAELQRQQTLVEDPVRGQRAHGSASDDVQTREPPAGAKANFLSGMARAVSSFPAAVEGMVQRTQAGLMGTSVHAVPDVDGFASAQSGSPGESGRPPSEGQVPRTPLFDQRSWERLVEMPGEAPLLFPRTTPRLYAEGLQGSGERASSTHSSDIQAEVRRQLAEFMAAHGDESVRLRRQVETLVTENRELRQRVERAQMRASGPGLESSGLPGLGWFGVPKATGEVPQPPPPPNRDAVLKSMLADAATILQQTVPVQATEVRTESSAGNSPTAPRGAAGVNAGTGATPQANAVTPGTPVSVETLAAQLESIRALARGFDVRTCIVDEVLTAECAVSRVLLDSGATHPVIPFREELGGLEKVSVTLAGDGKQQWLRTKGGTLVVPPSPGGPGGAEPPQSIVPLGALVESLGCSVTWSKRRGLRVVHPRLGLLKTGVLQIDVLNKGGRGWDLTSPEGVWSVLLWAAAEGIPFVREFPDVKDAVSMKELILYTCA